MSDPTNANQVTRRQILQGAAGVAAASVVLPVLANCSPPAATTVDAGPVTAFAPNTVRAVGNVIVVRDATGLYAYSSVCTHQGCTVPAPATTGGMSTCPCHSSQFDANGNVQPGGQASTNLPHYAVVINSGNVIVDLNMVVSDRASRTPAG